MKNSLSQKLAAVFGFETSISKPCFFGFLQKFFHIAKRKPGKATLLLPGSKPQGDKEPSHNAQRIRHDNIRANHRNPKRSAESTNKNKISDTHVPLLLMDDTVNIQIFYSIKYKKRCQLPRYLSHHQIQRHARLNQAALYLLVKLRQPRINFFKRAQVEVF